MPPQRLEDHLGLHAGVDEHQRHLVLLDQLVDLRERVLRGMAGPRQVFAGREHGDMRIGAAVGDDEIGPARFAFDLRNKKAAEVFGIGDGRGQTDGLQAGCELKQPRHAERKKIAAL